ncbi:alkaline phosphatase family protein [Isoptericola variabilis]|uniref:alkaline phosphatase family protein n=1 Tax=Isoptericola variabilis TaxID=139208 RepID=UPI0002EEC09E|nr:alkaline phosphatase family protein [Isoptericola variabilis]TWH31558.1 putative proteins of the AP superfamily [Isoptericola variabilis J7]
MLAVYCDTLDALGHAGGDAHPDIPAALEMIDAQLGRIVEATQDAGIYGRTAFVVMGDHGMTTFDKGFADEALHPGPRPHRVAAAGRVTAARAVGTEP